MEGSVDPSHFTVRARNGTPADPKQVIFPVFRLDDDGRMHIRGTGFFICEYGLFVSARHVFMDVVDERGQVADGLAIGHFINDTTFHARPVNAFVVHDQADVGVGVCAPMKHNVTGERLRNRVLTLNRTAPRLGDTVWTYAYPGTTVKGQDPQTIAINPNFYTGAITQSFPNGRDRVMHPAPCWQTSIVLHGGSSGGPVFGPGGRVVGVNSSGCSGAADISFVSRITDILPLGIRDAQVAGERAPRSVTIREMAGLGHVSFRAD